MKRSFITVFVLCLFAFTSVLGQRQVMEGVSISWGDTSKGHSEGKDFIGVDGEYVFLLSETVKTRKALYVIETYDKKGNFQKSKEISNKVGKEDVHIEIVLFLNGKLLLFTSQSSKKESTLYVQEVDKKSLEFVGEKRELMRTALPKGYLKSGYFHVLSPNQKYLAILNEKPQEDEDKEEVDVQVFNENMELIWSKTFDYAAHTSLMSDDGNLYRLFYSETNSNHWAINKYTDKGKVVNTYQLDMGDFSVYRIAIKLSEDNAIVCGGFYAESDDKITKDKKSKVLKHSFIGAFHAVTEANEDAVVKVTLNPFEADFLAKFSTKKTAIKFERLAFYKLRDMIVREDKSILLIGEQYFKGAFTYPNTGSAKPAESRSTFNSGPIIFTSINSSGEIEWVKKEEKYKAAALIAGYVTLRNLRYVKMLKNNTVYLIYNTINKKRDKKVVFLKVSEDGEIEKRTLQTQKTKEDKFPISTELSGRISDDELWINTHWGNKSKIGILTFK